MKQRYIFKVLLTLVFFILVGIANSQPDMNYSQYFNTPTYYNPAMTGSTVGVRARFLFRDQWPTLPIDYKSYFFSADLGDRSLPGAGGLGIIINQDTPGAGLINNFGAALNIAVRIPLTSFMVSQIGIKAGIMQRRINWDALVFADQLSPFDGNIYTSAYQAQEVNSRVVPDFGAGALLQFMNPMGTVNGNIGFAVDHLFAPDVSFFSAQSSPYPRKWVGQMDLTFTTGRGYNPSGVYRASDEPLKINVGVLYQNQGKLNALQVGLNLLKFNVYLGAWYKTTMTDVVNNSMALVAGYRYNFYEDMYLKFFYSYDLQISGALNGTGGAHEIGLVLEFDKLSVFGGRESGFGAGGGRGGYSVGGRRSGALECPSFY